MFEVGRLCVKIAGRDAKGLAVIVKKIDDNYVLIEGTVRRRKCNVKHLEPTKFTLDIKEEASREEVISKLKEMGFDIKEKKKREEKKIKSDKPVKTKKEKVKPVKNTKKTEKKEDKKKEETQKEDKKETKKQEKKD